MLKERKEKYNVLYCIHLIISCDFIKKKSRKNSVPKVLQIGIPKVLY